MFSKLIKQIRAGQFSGLTELPDYDFDEFCQELTQTISSFSDETLQNFFIWCSKNITIPQRVRLLLELIASKNVRIFQLLPLDVLFSGFEESHLGEVLFTAVNSDTQELANKLFSNIPGIDATTASHIIYVLAEKSEVMFLKHVPFLIKNGGDVFKQDNKAKPIQLLISNDLLQLFTNHFIKDKSFFQAKFERYLLDSALLTSIDFIWLRYDFCKLKDAGFLSDHFVKTFEPLLSNRLSFLEAAFKYFPMHELNAVSRMTEVTKLSEVPYETLLSMLSTAVYLPVYSKMLKPSYTTLRSLHLYDGGSSNDTWSSVTKTLFLKEPAKGKLNNSIHVLSLKNKIKSDQQQYQTVSFDLSEFTKSGWTFVRFQGRTILLEKDNKICAIKVRKKNEDKLALFQECATVQYFNQHRKSLNLKSKLPKAKGIFQLKGLASFLQEQKPVSAEVEIFNNLVDSNENYDAYIYEVDKSDSGYFTYLHDQNISEKDFSLANQVIVHDLFSLLKHGFVYHQLADVFHNNEEKSFERTDHGRYLTLANLLRDSDLGTGRLTAWLKSIEFVNLRLTGLADIGDWISLDEIFNDSPFTKKYFQDSQKKYGEKAGIYIYSNFIAEYLFILALCSGRRGRVLTHLSKAAGGNDKNIDHLWLRLAEQIITNCAQATSLMSCVPQDIAKLFLSNWVSTDHYAKQMRLWLTDEYIAVVNANNNNLQTMYQCLSILIRQDYFRPNTYSKQIGFALNGRDPDIGPVNGQNPIKEGDKLFYATVMVIHALNAQAQLDKAIREQAIKALKTQQYHKANALFQSTSCHLTTSDQAISVIHLCKQKDEEKLTDAEKFNRNEIVKFQQNTIERKYGLFWREKVYKRRMNQQIELPLPALSAHRICKN